MVYKYIGVFLTYRWTKLSDKEGQQMRRHLWGKQDTCLAFADDRTIISEKEEDAKNQLDTTNKIHGRTGLRIVYNRSKTLNITRD